MGRIYVHASWIEEKYSHLGDVDSDMDVKIYIDSFPEDERPKNVYVIIAILEPFNYHKNHIINSIELYPNRYDYIFTYYKDILEKYTNSLLSVTPTTWIPSDYKFGKKEFSVSSVFGYKHQSPYLPRLDGYNARWDLYTKKDLIKTNKKFFLSSHSVIECLDYDKNLVLYDTKEPLFDSQFHIAIENTRLIENAFSEKIIDCFRTKTVPIYYGPSNIGDFFNTDGIFCCNSVEEIITVCNGLTHEIYESMIPAIEDNYLRSERYSSFRQSMIDNTKKILENL